MAKASDLDRFDGEGRKPGERFGLDIKNFVFQNSLSLVKNSTFAIILL